MTNGAKQRAVKIGAQRDDSLPAKMRRDPTKHFAVESPDLGRCRRDALVEHFIGDAEFSERGLRVGREEQAESEFARVLPALVNDGVPACALERDCRRESADSGTNDQRFAMRSHAGGRSLRISWRGWRRGQRAARPSDSGCTRLTGPAGC